MRIPELYKQKNWQIFLSGIFLGSIIGWILFLYFFGELQDKQLNEIQKLQGEVSSLKKDKEVLYEDIKNANKKNLELLMLQEINIELLNSDKYHLSDLSEYKLKKIIRAEVSSLLTKNIDSVSENMEIIIKSIENKRYNLEKRIITIKVSRIVLTTTLSIDISIDNVEQK